VRTWRLLVTGGGTGGHIYPALAVARRAAELFPPVDVLYVGSRGGPEEDLVPREGVPFVAIPVTGLLRKRPAEAVRSLLRLGGSLRAALRALGRFRPDVVVGTGGYAAGPTGAAAVLTRRPLVLQG
jgi:UDP-N-acetylglucosamine--N-acetylmuramyl-(pentapeptide) pyrophosphoryl-undecaprenol N-acetylglucosamine transferase